MLTLRNFATMDLLMAPRLCPNSEIGYTSDFRMRVFQYLGLLNSEGHPVFQTRVLREWGHAPVSGMSQKNDRQIATGPAEIQWRGSSGLRPCR